MKPKKKHHKLHKSNLTERDKHAAGEPFDSAKLYQEMDDDMMDKLIEGIREANVPKKHPRRG